jgi:serine/threonine-protein kinase
MDGEHRQRIETLAASARGLTPERRDAFLARECGSDHALYDQVTLLLDNPNQTNTIPTVFVNYVLANRFRIVRHAGKGGMGDVFEAYDLELGESVAVKTIRPEIAADPVMVERFKREILLGKKVTHPNVCRIYDLGSGRAPDGRELLFLTMQFLPGSTLSSRIKRGAIPETEAVPLIEDMAAALAAAHNAGVVHRDFKSANVMLVPAEDRAHAVVTDFGLAHSTTATGHVSQITVTGAALGTAGYMAPEQVRGELATRETDIYALGIVIFEMLTGRRPFTGESDLSIALKQVNEEPPAPSSVAPELNPKWDEVILGCLKKDPAQRFHSAADVVDAIRGNVPETRPVVASGRRRWRFAALAIALVAAISSVLWFRPPALFRRTPEQERVAVLPFENVDRDSANQAFAEGLMETLAGQLTELEQFQGSLSVVPASDVRKEKVSSARQAQREFGVNLVITGSVQHTPGGVRLRVNVVDARKLKQLRSTEIFLPQTDPAAMQQGVVKQVSNLLDLELRPEAAKQLARGNTTVPGTYDFYLQGYGYLLSGRAGIDQAITEFRHALDLDPRYALAYAGLGQAYWSKYVSTKDRAWIDQAWDACQRALKLNPQSAATHIALAVLNNGTGQYAKAMQHATQAISIDPGNYQAYAELARAQERSHQLPEAEATLKSAIALRPNYWNSYVRLGSFYINQARYKDAEPLFQRVIELVPDNPTGYTNLGGIYHWEGREKEAEAMLKTSIQTRETQIAYSNLATVYFFLGKYSEAVPVMEHLVQQGTKDYMVWGNLGDAYRWAPGMRAKSLPAYRKAMEYANQALAVNHSDPGALSSLSLYQAKSGDLHAAITDSTRSLEAAPEASNILFNAAVVQELAGNRDSALKYLAMAAKQGYSRNEIQAEPELSKLRDDKRYASLIVSRPTESRP